jgi:hypothetical protein
MDSFNNGIIEYIVIIIHDNDFPKSFIRTLKNVLEVFMLKRYKTNHCFADQQLLF